MFKSKSFDLNNEENSKLPEHLYQPRRIRWMKYIIIPVGVCFVLLLIICNIDFSTEQSHTNRSKYLQSAKWCTTNCKTFQTGLYCVKNVNNLKNCIDNLLLHIENYNFPEGIITSDVFADEYRLQSLVLSNCSLIYIEDGAFDRTNLRNLQDLELLNTQLKYITRKTFQGLHKLRNFSLFNNRKMITFESFMTPIASTVRSASIHQQYSGHSIYTPLDFFGTVVYKNLKSLDLRGNNFGSILEMNWFNNMPVLESLILADCRFNSINLDIKDETVGKLRFLDLSGNRLLKISSEFIAHSIEKGIRLNLLNRNTKIKEFTVMPSTILSKEIRAIDFDISGDTDATDSIESTVTTTTTKTTTRKPPRPGPTPPKTTPKTTEPTTLNTTVPLNNTDITTPLDEDFTTQSTLNNTEITTPISENVTIPSDQSDIICLNAAKDTIYNLSMVCNARFRIVQQVESVLYITVSQVTYDYWNMVYFSHNSSVSYVHAEDIDVGLMGNMTVTVRDLNCTTSYVFCLMQGTEISPFNCQSYHTMMCDKTKSSWFEDHSVMIISLAIVGILLFVVIGGLAMYATLWHRPTWLCGSKRLQRTTRDSLTMLLLPPSYQKEAYAAIRSKNGDDAIGDYVAYYRHLEQAKLYETESNKYNIPPQESAPPVPNTNSHTYECFDLYEELS
ncbi:uncharacterized protein LOC117784653 [Drosophila innubila]|uniref:uncharacterized protein LOC117784653 n=1 Tax=Drosophila innubila TaxID=198719 RepID=UPI00148C0032|nr:uncharacterized protein LOC117784653 [Drosophila innubila]